MPLDWMLYGVQSTRAVKTLAGDEELMEGRTCVRRGYMMYLHGHLVANGVPAKSSIPQYMVVDNILLQ